MRRHDTGHLRDLGYGYTKTITYFAASTTTLYLKVGSYYPGSDPGDYRLSVKKVVSDAFEPDGTAAQANPIATDGTPQTHRIEPAADVDWVKFDVVKDYYYYISAKGDITTDTVSPDLRVYAAVDATTPVSSDTSYGYAKTITYFAASTTTLYLKVGSYYPGSDPGDYRLSVKKVVSDAFEPDGTAAQANPIATDGTPQTHRIEPAADVDWVKFDVVKDYYYYISAKGDITTDTVSPDLRVYAAVDATTPVSSDTSYGYAKTITYFAASTTTLYLKVGSYYPGSDPGDYRLSVKKVVSDAFEPDGTAAQANPIATDGTPQTHRIEPAADVDWVKFQVDAGRAYLVAADGDVATDTIYPELRVYAAADATTPIASETGYGYTKTLIHVADSNTTLYVKASSYYSDDAGDYRVLVGDLTDAFESDDSFVAARRVLKDVEQSRAISPGDSDWVYFDVDGLLSYTVEAVPAELGGVTPDIELYDSDGTTSLKTGSRKVDYVADTGRRLYARVSGATAQDGGYYNFVLRRTTGPVLWAVPGDSSVSLDNVLFGTTGRKTIKVVSAGTASVSVTSAGISGGSGFALLGMPQLPASLAPGQSMSFDIAFTPTAPAPTGPPRLHGSYNGSSLFAVYSMYSATITPPYDFENIGGPGVATKSWLAGYHSGTSTQTVAAGAIYTIEWRVPTTNNWSGGYTGHTDFVVTLPGSSLSFGLGCTATGAGYCWLDRVPNGSLSIKTDAGDKTWSLYGSTGASGTRASTLTLSAPSIIGYGASATLSGKLSADTGAAMAGRSLTVEAAAIGSSTWRALGTVKTTSSGTYAYSVKPALKTTYRVRFFGDATFAPRSASRAVTPRAYMGTPVAPSSAYHAKAFATYGYLKPRHTSGSYPVRIYKYRLVRGKWKSYGYVNARAYNYSSYTKFSVGMKLPYAGKWRLRAYHADSGHAARWSSGYDYVTVR